MSKQSTIVILVGLGVIALIIEACSNRSIPAQVDAQALPDYVDYNFHVKPILSDRCFACHGPDEAKREAGLRLDTPDGMFAELEEGGYSIVKGKPSKSKMVKRIHATDEALIMPPPESNLSLSNYEIALLEKWIKQGAEYKEHWAFIPPQKADLPEIENEAWAQNEIDYFILDQIEKSGFQPSEKASKEMLIRRASFDLTGLPPSLEEIDDFLADDSENAFEKVIDRLLASEKYGERMASDWLSVSRYGDTHGYEADSRRMAWQWRDWVINAFNDNMPYDQFITEQIAGDLLPQPTRDQLTATSFNRNHLMNSENGILDEEWRVEYVSDRTNTTGKAIMGLTMECAKCHDHKYDPISQKEYYSLFAFFNNTDENGQIRWQTQAAPVLDLTEPEQDRKLEELEKVSNEQRQQIAQYVQQVQASEDWKSKLNKNQINLNKGLKVHVSLDGVSSYSGGKAFKNLADVSRPLSFNGDLNLVDGPVGKALVYDGINETIMKDSESTFASNQAFSDALWVNFPEPFSHARILGTEDGTFDKVPGYYLFIEDDKLTVKLCNTWDYNYIELQTRNSFPFDKWTHLSLTYDGSSKASGVKIYFDGEPVPLRVIKDNLSKNLNVLAWFKLGHDTFEGGAIDDYRQYNRVLSQAEIQTLANKEVSEEAWRDFYLNNQDKELAELRNQLKSSLQDRIDLLDSVPQLMVMGDLKDSVRPTYVLNRGIYDDLGDEVFAQTPSAILEFNEELPQNRLGLTQWIFDEQNPLTSRVMINRLWQGIFGKGLVSTPDDFGNQGALPTHPELLDWLAVEFQEESWNMKAMLKMLMMSATYQQSSVVSPELLEADPNNDLLARGASYRLPAEMVRDNALALSGLLVDSIGGEPVKPYQPAGIWAQVSSLKTPYEQDHGDKLYRRSLYTYWKRAAPPPNMLIFDAPSRHTCTVKREATSTPLQALILLNDIQFVEAARVFSQNLLAENLSEQKMLEKAFRMATSRTPQDEEISILESLLQETRLEFSQDIASAREVINIGEHPIDDPFGEVELASLSVVVSAILNMNETITKR